MKHTKPLELVEYEPKRYNMDDIPDTIANIIWNKYRKQIQIDFPSPIKDNCWCFTPRGWVGQITLTNEYCLILKPKIPVSNIFSMLQYAYNLKSFHIFQGIVNCDSVKGFFEQLADILAKMALERLRKGLYRAYNEEIEQLSYVSGSVDVKKLSQQSWNTRIWCKYNKQEVDIEDNQIIAWTLNLIIRSYTCSSTVLSRVREAYNAMMMFVSIKPFTAKDCTKRLYNQLNQDYRVMHTLCSFFLNNSIPGHNVGDNLMMPFLVNMEKLFERFVYEWLRYHLPAKYKVERQYNLKVGSNEEINLYIDLVIYNSFTGLIEYVLDTKYRKSMVPTPHDYSQIVLYALAKSCKKAILIYPSSDIYPFYDQIQGIIVRSIPFDISGNIEEAGEEFTRKLFDIECTDNFKH